MVRWHFSITMWENLRKRGEKEEKKEKGTKERKGGSVVTGKVDKKKKEKEEKERKEREEKERKEKEKKEKKERKEKKGEKEKEKPTTAGSSILSPRSAAVQKSSPVSTASSTPSTSQTYIAPIAPTKGYWEDHEGEEDEEFERQKYLAFLQQEAEMKRDRDRLLSKKLEEINKKEKEPEHFPAVDRKSAVTPRSKPAPNIDSLLSAVASSSTAGVIMSPGRSADNRKRAGSQIQRRHDIVPSASAPSPALPRPQVQRPPASSTPASSLSPGYTSSPARFSPAQQGSSTPVQQRRQIDVGKPATPPSAGLGGKKDENPQKRAAEKALLASGWGGGSSSPSASPCATPGSGVRYTPTAVPPSKANYSKAGVSNQQKAAFNRIDSVLYKSPDLYRGMAKVDDTSSSHDHYQIVDAYEFL